MGEIIALIDSGQNRKYVKLASKLLPGLDFYLRKDFEGWINGIPVDPEDENPYNLNINPGKFLPTNLRPAGLTCGRNAQNKYFSERNKKVF